MEGQDCSFDLCSLNKRAKCGGQFSAGVALPGVTWLHETARGLGGPEAWMPVPGVWCSLVVLDKTPKAWGCGWSLQTSPGADPDPELLGKEAEPSRWGEKDFPLSRKPKAGLFGALSFCLHQSKHVSGVTWGICWLARLVEKVGRTQPWLLAQLNLNVK